MGFSSFLQTVLHFLSSFLLVPVMVVLIVLVLYTVFALGACIVEACTERRAYKVDAPRLVALLVRVPARDLGRAIRGGGLHKSQEAALNTLLSYYDLPIDALCILAQKLAANLDIAQRRRIAPTDMVAKLGPMFGLMGTLIPLGPGIMALGQGDTATLSSSIMVAFDTTVAGLIAAAICFVISKLRKGWYADYAMTLESCLSALLEKAESLDVSARAEIARSFGAEGIPQALNGLPEEVDPALLSRPARAKGAQSAPAHSREV